MAVKVEDPNTQEGQVSELEKVRDKDDGAIRLKPRMSLMNGVSVIVGSIIGSGIFVSPTGVLKGTGSFNLALIIWTLCGVLSMIGAYCYAELGCMISKSGADYAYIMTAFGPFSAFIRLWVECIVIRPCSQAIIALTFAGYIQKNFFIDCEAPPVSTVFLAITCIFLLTFVNCWSVKVSTRVQDAFTFAKLLALFIIIGTGIYQLFTGHVEYFTFKGSETDVSTVTLAFYSGLFAYSGWNDLNIIIEELKDPIKTLPRAIAISLSLVTFVYIMTNVAFYTTLSPEEMLQSKEVAVTFANKLFGSFAVIIPIFVAMSTFGAVNGNLLTSSRLFYVGAREGQMPEFLTMIQVPHRTPVPAVLCTATLTIFFLFFKIGALINCIGFVSWLIKGLAVACIPYLRWKRPEMVRPIRVNLLFPIIYILATLFIIIVSTIASPIETLYGFLLMITGVPVYFVFIYWSGKPKCINNFVGKMTVAMQKLFVIIQPDGGKHQ